MVDFENRIDDFSGDYEIAQMIDEWPKSSWQRIVKELYELGAIGYTATGAKTEELFNFHFRGNTDELILTKNLTLVKPKGLRSP